MENRISMKKKIFNYIKRDTKLKKKDYTSKIMFLLSKKLKRNQNEKFFTNQIRFYILKNQINNKKILDLVKKNGIDIKNSEFSSQKTINNLEKSIQSHLCNKFFIPLDFIFIKTKQRYDRVFLKNLFIINHNKKLEKKVELFKKFINNIDQKIIVWKKDGFQTIKKYKPTNYKMLILFLQFFHTKKKKEISIEFFTRLKNCKVRKNSFLWVLCNKFYTWKKYNFLYFKLKSLNSQKIVRENISSLEEIIDKKDIFQGRDEQELKYNLNFFCKRLARLKKKQKKILKKNYKKLLKNMIELRERDKNDKLKIPRSGFQKLQKLIKKKRKDYFEEMYYFQGYLEIIEIEDRTFELEPKTLQHTFINSNTNSKIFHPINSIEKNERFNSSQIYDSNLHKRSRFGTFKNNNKILHKKNDFLHPDSKIAFSKGTTFEKFENNNRYENKRNFDSTIRRSHYFNPEEQIYRSQALMKNLQNITTIGDIKGPTFDKFDNKQNVYKSQIFGSRTSLNPLFRKNSIVGEDLMITEIHRKKRDTPFLTRDKQNNLSFKSLEEKHSPVSSFLQRRVFK